MKRDYILLAAIVSLALFVLMLSGCASNSPPPVVAQPPPNPPVSVLPSENWQPRASAYWNEVEDFFVRALGITTNGQRK